MNGNYDLAKSIVGKRRTDIRDANSLASKPAIAVERATSHNVLKDREKRATSINDILDTYCATGLLQDPELRDVLLFVSSRLNRAF